MYPLFTRLAIRVYCDTRYQLAFAIAAGLNGPHPIHVRAQVSRWSLLARIERRMARLHGWLAVTQLRADATRWTASGLANGQRHVAIA